MNIIPTNGTWSKVIGNLGASGWKIISGTQSEFTGSLWETDSEPNHPQWSMGLPDGPEKSPTGLFSLPRCSLRVWGLLFSIVFFSLREWREVRSAERTAVNATWALLSH